MRVGHVQPSRANWYDRTPVSRAQAYASGGTAPHGATTRWTYTCPSGKKAFLAAAHVQMIRITVAAPVGTSAVSVYYTPSGGSATTVCGGEMINNTVGGEFHESLAPQLAMLAGDVLLSQTSDISTGGTFDYVSTALVGEYDA